MNVKSILVAFAAMFAVTGALAQDTAQEKEVKKISKKACGCADEISTAISKEEIVEKINSCITASIVGEQLDSSLKGLKDIQKTLKEAKVQVKDGDTTLVVDSDKKTVIYADKNFREIQQYLMKNCPNIKTLMSSEDMMSDMSISSNPDAYKHYQEAEKLEEKGKYEKAIENYKKAVAIDPVFAFAWDNMGLCYRKLNNFDEAIRCYKKSLEIDP